MNNAGIVYPDGSFESADEVKRRLYLNSQFPDPALETPLPLKKDFRYWNNRFRLRQREYLETKEITQHAVISFPERTLITFIGDLHVGSGEVDYKRIEQEIELIVNTPNSYVCLMGDVIDGFFFNPAQMEEMEQVPEQVAYMQALVEYLAEHKKLLIGWGGDHDQTWQAQRGMNPYTELADRAGAYYMHGVGYMTAKVGNQEYHLTGTHRTQGHSIYNNAHGAMRLGRDAEGSDIVVIGHNHRKGIVQQSVKEYGGENRVVTYIALGAYKSTDDYSKKLGFADNNTESMFGVSVVLEKDSKQVKPYYDIVEAHREFIR